MITEQDLQEAIAECEGVRNPNANTCIKLAAFYTIKNELFGNAQVPSGPLYSYANGPSTEAYTSDTEFGKILGQKKLADVMPIVDEAVMTLQVVNPRLYDAVMRKLNEL